MDTGGEILRPQEQEAAARWGREALLLGLIVAVAALARFLVIGELSLWWDEGYSLDYARRPLGEMLELVRREDSNPPLYYVLLHYWIGVFGHGEGAARAMGAVFSVAAVPLIYVLGRRMGGALAGAAAAALLAINPYHIAYAQEARSYSLMVLLTLGSMLALLRWLDRPTPWRAAGYVLLTALLPYTHLYGMLVIFAQCVWVGLLLWRGRSAVSWRRWVAIQSVIGVLLIPFAMFMAYRARQAGGGGGFWIPRPGLFKLVEAYGLYAGAEGASRWALRMGGGFVAALVAAGVALMGLVVWRMVSSVRRASEETGREAPGDSSRDYAWLLGLWLTLPVLIPFAVSQLLMPMFLARYAIGASCAGYLAVGWLLARWPARRAAAVTFLGIALVNAAGVWAYYRDDSSPPWRQVVRYIETRARGGDLVLLHRADNHRLLYRYYATRDDLDVRGVGDPIVPIDVKQAEELLRPATGRERVWLVLYHPNDPQRLLQRNLERTHEAHPTPFGPKGDWNVQAILYKRRAGVARVVAGE